MRCNYTIWERKGVSDTMDNKCKLGIMQPYFLPYLGYFQLMNAVDKYVVYDDVNYIKGGWINRNHILANSAASRINLILREASPNKLINEVGVMHNNDKLLRTITMSYSKSPYFKEVYPVVEKIITYEEDNLGLYLYHQFSELCKYMQIDTELILSSTLNKDCSLKAEDKVLHICGILNAGEYFNSIGGLELYSKERFKENGIELHFMKMKSDVTYKQYNDTFIPNLSIVDVMMFNSVEQIHELLNQYELF